MNLFYDDRDDYVHQQRGSRILYWLDDLNGIPIADLQSNSDDGFFFSVAGSISDYAELVVDRPNLRDRSEERLPLMSLASVLDRLSAKAVDVPMSRTWRLAWNEPIPDDIVYPLFVRASDSSLKLGGAISRVRNANELLLEAEEIRRLLGWNSLVLAREWKECVPAGTGTYGVLPQEIRVWVVDGKAFAWSFQHLKEVPLPMGFPPSAADLQQLSAYAERVAAAFESRCLVVDFACEVHRGWTFVDAGSASSAMTDHEGVFKAVASKLIGKNFPFHSDKVGGRFSA
jgi:hypothetical protein